MGKCAVSGVAAVALAAVLGCGGSSIQSSAFDGRQAPPDPASSDTSDAGIGPLPPPAPVPHPQEAASRQAVRFHFPTAASGYVVTQGNRCDVLEIAPAGGGAPLALEVPWQCVCECAAPGAAGPSAAHALHSAGTVVTWDARSVVTFETPVNCASRGFPSAGLEQQVDGVLQPVKAGSYRASFTVLAGIPDGCRQLGAAAGPDGGANPADDIYCNSAGGPGPFNGTAAPGLCKGSSTVSVDFVLPPAGDLDVDVVF